MPTADYRSRPPAPANITAPARSGDGAITFVIARSRRRRSNPVLSAANMDCFASLAMTVANARPSRKIRRVGFAKNVDGIARLQVAPLKGRIGIEHEIADRERTDRVKSPGRDTFHQLRVLLASAKAL